MSVQNRHFLRPPSPTQKVNTSTFFKWIICHKGANMLKVYGINFYFLVISPSKGVPFVYSVSCWQLWTVPLNFLVVTGGVVYCPSCQAMQCPVSCYILEVKSLWNTEIHLYFFLISTAWTCFKLQLYWARSPLYFLTFSKPHQFYEHFSNLSPMYSHIMTPIIFWCGECDQIYKFSTF